MKHNIMVKLLISLICVFFIFSFSAFKTTGEDIDIGWGPESKGSHPIVSKKVGKGSPPPHAPAYGYRAKYTYRYYPSACIYFDASRKTYFYLEGNNWRMSLSLPQDTRLQLDDYVTIEMETDKPYTMFKEHKRKYPPGQLKKKKKKRAK
jgi:hypothetical protein